MARDRTYLDLVEEINETKEKKVIAECLGDIKSKYGVAAANKAYDACKLDSQEIPRPI